MDYKTILAAYGYDYLVATVGIPGPGNTIVIFATLGDFRVACIDYKDRVVWEQSAADTIDDDQYSAQSDPTSA